MAFDDDHELRTIQIATIPRPYTNQSASSTKSTIQDARNTLLKFERFLGGTLYNDVPFAYRMRMGSGKVELSFVASQASRRESIKASFLAHFPDFTLVETVSGRSFSKPVACALIIGIPQLSPAPLNGLTENMIQSKAECLYQVWAVPKKPSRTQRFMTKKRIQSASGESQMQESQPGFFGKQEIRTRIDPDAMHRSKRY